MKNFASPFRVFLALLIVTLISCQSHGVESAITPIPLFETEKAIPFEFSEDLYRDAEYTIRAGDTITIEIVGQEDSKLTVPVRPDGFISYKYVGDVKAAGETFKSLDATLEFKLKEYFTNPSVTLIANTFSGQTVTILGEAISSPGRYSLTQRTRILDALAMAGGLKLAKRNDTDVTVADLKKAKLLRNNKELPIDLHRLYFDQEWRFNIPLHSGDTLIIPTTINSSVLLVGEITEPKSYAYSPQMTIGQLIANGGYFTDDSSKTHILLTRRSGSQSKVYRVDFTKIETGQAPDIEVQPGDIVYVPRSAFGQLTLIATRLSTYASAFTSVDEVVKILEN